MRLPFSPSPGPVKPRRQVPPYLPMLWSGFTTIGSSGMRWVTGGSLPAFTSSASIGASPNFLGHFAGSRTSSGPSSFPMSWAPSFGSAWPARAARIGAPAKATAPEASAVRCKNSRRVTPVRLRAICLPPGLKGSPHDGSAAVAVYGRAARDCQRDSGRRKPEGDLLVAAVRSTHF